MSSDTESILRILPPVEMTEHRVWALYCVGRMSYRMIEESTGWTHDQLKNGIDKWRLARTGAKCRASEEQLCSALARAFHIDSYFEDVRDLTEAELGVTLTRISHLHDAAQRVFRDRLERCLIGWDQIDALKYESAFSFLVRALEDDMKNPHA